MEYYSYVYRITCLLDMRHYYGCRYIKMTKRFGKTAMEDLKHYKSSSKILLQDIKDKGIENFKFKIIKTFNAAEDAINYEIMLHKKFSVDTNQKFYNLVKQTSSRFASNNKEVGKKISASLIGRKMSESFLIENRLNSIGEKNGMAKIFHIFDKDWNLKYTSNGTLFKTLKENNIPKIIRNYSKKNIKYISNGIYNVSFDGWSIIEIPKDYIDNVDEYMISVKQSFEENTLKRLEYIKNHPRKKPVIKFTEETRKRMSIASKEKYEKLSDEEKLKRNKKISDTKLKNHPLRDKTFEEYYGESRAKEIREKLKSHKKIYKYTNLKGDTLIGDVEYLKENCIELRQSGRSTPYNKKRILLGKAGNIKKYNYYE